MSNGGPEGRWRKCGERAGRRHAARHPPGARGSEWEEEGGPEGHGGGRTLKGSPEGHGGGGKRSEEIGEAAEEGAGCARVAVEDVGHARAVGRPRGTRRGAGKPEEEEEVVAYAEEAGPRGT